VSCNTTVLLAIKPDRTLIALTIIVLIARYSMKIDKNA
jgi:hypothetical protein